MLDRDGEQIRSVNLERNNVIIETARGDKWRVWIDWGGQPLIELIERQNVAIDNA